MQAYSPPLLLMLTLICGTQLLFAQSKSIEPTEQSVSKQSPDGLAVNKAGVLFVAGPDGIVVLSPEGKHLGTIQTNKRTSNCVFNEDETVLYATCDDYILRIILGYKLGFEK